MLVSPSTLAWLKVRSVTRPSARESDAPSATASVKRKASIVAWGGSSAMLG